MNLKLLYINKNTFFYNINNKLSIKKYLIYIKNKKFFHKI